MVYVPLILWNATQQLKNVSEKKMLLVIEGEKKITFLHLHKMTSFIVLFSNKLTAMPGCPMYVTSVLI